MVFTKRKLVEAAAGALRNWTAFGFTVMILFLVTLGRLQPNYSD